jgi:hypothetical protein
MVARASLALALLGGAAALPTGMPDCENQPGHGYDPVTLPSGMALVLRDSTNVAVTSYTVGASYTLSLEAPSGTVRRTGGVRCAGQRVAGDAGAARADGAQGGA